MVPRLFLALATLVVASFAGCLGGGGAEENQAPTADIKIQPGTDGYHYILSGTGSSDPDGDKLSYVWNWQLGTSSEKAFELELDPNLGNAQLQVSLVVRDPQGKAAVALSELRLGNGTNASPKAAIDNNVTRWVVPNGVVVMDGRLTSDPDGDALAYEWIWGPLADYDVHVSAPADGSASTDLRAFSTGYLAEGQSFSLVFDRPGTFNYHCHPHPWMKARLVVDPAMPASPDTTVEIADFSFPNQTTIVGVGTNVTFRNADPVPHTATVEDYTPGIRSAGNGPIFDQQLEEGDYVARLIATDGKGGRSTRTWGLKASTDAPPNPTIMNWSSEANAVLVADNTIKIPPFEANFGYSVQAVLSWQPQGQPFTGTVVGNFSLVKVLPDGTGESPVGACQATIGSAFEDADKAFMSCRIKALVKEKYSFHVTAEGGAMTSWNLVFSGTPFSFPPFGDAEEGGHAHHH